MVSERPADHVAGTSRERIGTTGSHTLCRVERGDLVRSLLSRFDHSVLERDYWLSGSRPNTALCSLLFCDSASLSGSSSPLSCSSSSWPGGSVGSVQSWSES